jgi:hypothetical protein
MMQVIDRGIRRMLLSTLKTSAALLLAVTMLGGATAYAADADDLAAMLHEFLAGADNAAAHDKFWADELVYTSSSGTRTSKAEIMQGFAEADEDTSTAAGPVYTGEDLQIQIFGTTAIVAFRLVATPVGADDSAVQSYFNTGTFLKRNGVWKVVAWQATKIPGS